MREEHPQKTISYSYDAAGNRLSKTEGSQTTSYTYDAAERMTAAGSETFSYDNNGNITSRTNGSETTEYSYDSRDRLVQAGEKSYQRDARGRAVSIVEGGEQTEYVFDGQQIIREINASGGEEVDYTRGLANRLISRQQQGDSSYYHHDSIGSVVGLSDGSGALSDSYSYDAFGNELSRAGNSEQPYRYVGNRHDPQSGLSDFHARSYDPKKGRFTSKDPVRGTAKKAQTMNPYSYGINGPLAHPDPSGLCVFLCPHFGFGQEARETLDKYCAPVATMGAGNQCSGGSEEDPEMVDRVEDPTVADGAPEPPAAGGQYEEPATDGPISMDEAVERGSEHVGGQGEMMTTKRGNYQFNNQYYDADGNRVNEISRFDVNPDDPHVQYLFSGGSSPEPGDASQWAAAKQRTHPHRP